MTSRERIIQTLEHREPDRVPRDLGGTESSGMTAYALSALNERLSIQSDLKIFEPYQYVAYISDELQTRFGIDTCNLTIEPERWKLSSNPMGINCNCGSGFCCSVALWEKIASGISSCVSGDSWFCFGRMSLPYKGRSKSRFIREGRGAPLGTGHMVCGANSANLFFREDLLRLDMPVGGFTGAYISAKKGGAAIAECC